MKRRLCLPIILALTLAILAGLSGCGEKAVRFPYPMIPPTGGEGELSYELSPELTFPETAEMEVFRFVPLEADAGLSAACAALGVPRDALGEGESGGNFYSFETEGQRAFLYFDTATGYWQFRLASHARPCADPITAETAVEIAKQFITDGGLYDGDLGEALIGTETTGSEFEEGGEQLVTWIVTYTPRIAGRAVYGLHRISVDVGVDGTIRAVLYQVAPVELAGTVPLQDWAATEEWLLQYPQEASASAYGLQDAVVDGCELAYYADGYEYDGGLYALPIYVFTGSGAAPDGSTQYFDIMLTAQSSER